MSDIDRLLDLCIPEPNTGCWIWLGKIARGGYGQVKAQGKFHRAHRLSYQMLKGAIPPGQFVCHACDNRWCINPDHLFCGTHMDNMNDCRRKGRFHSWAGERKGAANPKAILTPDKVVAIKKLGDMDVKANDLAMLLGVSITAIRDIWNGRTWEHLKP